VRINALLLSDTGINYCNCRKLYIKRQLRSFWHQSAELVRKNMAACQFFFVSIALQVLFLGSSKAVWIFYIFKMKVKFCDDS